MQFKQWMLFTALGTSLVLGLIGCGSAGPIQPDPKLDSIADPKPEPVAASDVSGQAIHWQEQGRAGIFRAVVSTLDANALQGLPFL
jgi:hypothetical protein